MNFSEQPPSEQWVALKFRGETFAEVWFKPEGDPFALAFRIPQSGFQIPGVGQRLTIEKLLKIVGVATEEVESWRDEGEPHSETKEPGPELRQPLAPPPPDVAHLVLHISLKPPPQPAAPAAGGESEIPEATWQFLEARWNSIVGLEAGVDNLRMSMDGLRIEMETAARKVLSLEVKVNALSSDVAQWTKAKNRIHYALPKVREFIHRATWATGTAERKKLTEQFEQYIQPRIPFPQMEELMTQFEGLLKDRQTLFAQGTSIYQDCKALCAECQGLLATLQSNAASKASRKSGGLGSKKGFKA